MFSLSAPGNNRCNGVVENGNRQLGRSQKTSLAVNSPYECGKIKLTDRCRTSFVVHESTIKTEPVDDPYMFNDSEYHQANQNNGSQVQRKSVQFKSELDWKTINRLQAQIARNKVIVKHNKETTAEVNTIVTEDKTTDTKTSIIVDSNVARRANVKRTHHEALQRIRKKQRRPWHAPGAYGSLAEIVGVSDNESSDEWTNNVRVRPPCTVSRPDTDWAEAECNERRREERIRRSVARMRRLCSRLKPSEEAVTSDAASTSVSTLLASVSSKYLLGKCAPRSKNNSGSSRTECVYVETTQENGGEGVACGQTALPCTRHCTRHIMHNTDQLLFHHCTAKFADNTQCCAPVLHLGLDLPLCAEHARKRDNYNRMCQETKPKKPRKKVKPSAMIRPQKRNKKRKRAAQSTKPVELSSPKPALPDVNSDSVVNHEPVAAEPSVVASDSTPQHLKLNVMANSSELEPETRFVGPEEEPDEYMVAQVLGVVEDLPLVTQASRLLEETDFTTVLNQIPPDAFNDLFTIDRNGSYEPTREETEELERALEAVDQDVKSLEKMSQTQGLLDALLDETDLADVIHTLNAHTPT